MSQEGEEVRKGEQGGEGKKRDGRGRRQADGQTYRR